ncbi:hypothetical protein F5887DRAFT_1162309 [Amanita rubescens]|nr:hypothetical protein F5887DRAFT_1162309 [Amanita rubescens]
MSLATRGSSHDRVSQNSYNAKDPPEIGSRRGPVSREALSSFSKFVELFYPKALSEYSREREVLKDGLSVVREAHEYIQEKVQLEPNSNEWRLKLRAIGELVACHENKLSERKHARFRREKSDKAWVERDKIRVEEQKKSDEKLDLWSKHCRELLEALIRETENLAKPYSATTSVGSAIRAASSPRSSGLEGRTMPSPTHTPNGSSRPRPVFFKGIYSQATSATQEVSIHEASNSPERVQTTRPIVNPSSTKPDSPSAPQGTLHQSPRAPKHMTTRSETPKSTSETGLPISRLQPRPGVRVKPLERLNTVVLSRESPKGNSLMGITPSSRIVSAPTPKRVKVHTPENRSVRKVKVSTQKRTSASRHSPWPNAALTPRNSTAVLSIRPPLTRSSKNGSKPSSQITLKTSPSNIVNARRVVSETTRHDKIETPSRVSLESSSPQFGEPLLIAVSAQRKVSVADSKPTVNKTHRNIKTHVGVLLKTAVPRVGKPLSAGIVERLDERSNADTGLTDKLQFFLLLRWRRDGRIMGKNGKTHSPLNNAVLSLRNPLPPVSLAPASCISLSKDGSAPSSLSSLCSREVATQLASNVVSTRREASIITHCTPKTCPRVPLSFSSPRFSETPLRAVFGGRKHSVTGSENAVRNGNHLNKETCKKVSSKTYTPRVEPPPADVLERSKKRSNVVVGPAIKRTLISSSSEVEEKRRVPTTVVSKRKGMNKETHAPVDNTTFRLPSPALVSSISTLHTCPSLDEVIPSSPAAAIPDTVHTINNGQLASVNAYREAETLVRVSLETAILRSGEPPSTGIRERSYECSDLSKGLLYNEVLDKSASDRTKEEQRALETIVNTQCKNGELSSPASKAAPMLLESAPVSSIRAFPANSSSPRRAPLADSSKDGISPSSRANLKSRASNVVTRASSQVSHSLALPLLDKSPHLAISVRHIPSVVETRSRVSFEAATPRFGKTPSAGDIERSGPAVEQALTSLSAEVGERRRVTDTIALGVHNLRSPSFETARKRSNQYITPFSAEGEGQLARAAVYIQERLKRRSAAFDEFPRHSPKVPPDKQSEFASTGIASRCLKVDVVSKEMKADVARTSPIRRTESLELSCSSLEAAPGSLASTPVAPIADGHETKPRRLEQAVEAYRRSNEHLETEESVSKGPAIPTLVETLRDSRETLICGWKAIQDGVVCFAVLQETSTADNDAGALRQSKNAVAPLREPNFVSDDTMSVRTHSPAFPVTPLLPMLSSARSPHAPSPRQPGLASDETLLESSEDGDPERCPHGVVSGGGKANLSTRSPRSTVENVKFSNSKPEAVWLQPNETVGAMPHQCEADLPYSGCSESVSMLARPTQTADVSEEPATPALQVPEGEQTIASTKRQLTSLAADSFSESSMRPGQLVLKPPDEGGPQQYPCDAIMHSFSSNRTNGERRRSKFISSISCLSALFLLDVFACFTVGGGGALLEEAAGV